TTGILPATTNLSIASGATLDVNGTLQQIATLNGPAGAAVTLGAGQLTVSSATNSQFDGTISGTGGSLVKNGTGALTLTGALSYTGATTLNGGKLSLQHAPNSSSAININNGTLALTGSGEALVRPVTIAGAPDAWTGQL